MNRLQRITMLAAIFAVGLTVVCAQQPATPDAPGQVPENSTQVPTQLPSSPMEGGMGKPQLPADTRPVKPHPSSVDAARSGATNSAGNAFPAVIPPGRPVIGLALEGGGALGIAHVGVIRWLEEHHVPIDRVAGTSMGALVGGIYASGGTPEAMLKVASGVNFEDVFQLEAPYSELDYRRREDRRALPQGIKFGLEGGLNLRNAVLSDNGLNNFLASSFIAYEDSDLNYDTMAIPFRCVATDLNESKPVVFHGGPLNQSVRASISIPAVFSPVMYHGHYLIDGAIVDNLPTDIARNDLHSDVVIAVLLQDTPFSEGNVSSIVGVMATAFSVGTERNVQQSLKQADLIISPQTGKFTVADYGKGKELADTGYEAAEKQRASLLKYALSDSDWAAYVAARNARIHGQPGLLEAVKVEGGLPEARAEVRQNLAPLTGKPLDTGKIVTALGDVQGSGLYTTGVQTYRLEQTSAQGVGASAAPDTTQAAGPDTGVLVRLDKVRGGPPFVILGADIIAQTGNVTRMTFDMRVLDENLGGYGSELRTDLRLGYFTQLSSEYYRRLSPRGYFFQPDLGLIRKPVYLWANQKRISERQEQQLGGGLELGRTFSKYMQLSGEWRDQSVRWSLQEGVDADRNLSGTSQTSAIHFTYDTTESGTVSPTGMRLDLKAGSLFHTFASQNAPLFEGQVARSFSFADKDIVAFLVDGNSYFRRDVADPLRFTLGGPLRLSASSMDEYRGTDDYLVRAAFLRRLAALPSGLGQGLYLATGYEGGEIWSPEQAAILRQDGFVSLGANTPFGMLTLGTAVGDAGRRKVFFTVGRLF